MSRLIDIGLEQLVNSLFNMGKLAEKTVSLALDGYIKRVDVHEKVYSWSDALLSMNEEVEDKAIELIARYQPVASDLRIITSYIKIAYDFSRFGRYARDISFIYNRFAGLEECDLPWMNIEEMGVKVLEMVHKSVEAVKNYDADLAKSLVEAEEAVDTMYFKYLDRLATEAQTATKCLISTLLTVRCLERIADHATYIGESVVYIATSERVTLR